MKNIHKLYTKFYGNLYNRNMLPSIFLSPLRRITRILAAHNLPKYLSSAPRDKSMKKCDNVIVSLTSYPARIDDIWMTISCLLRQTYLPYKIILWLSKEQFERIEIPQSLLALQNDIFEIRFVDGDLRSHKKYYYAFREFYDKIVITVDDDIIYTPDMIESLIKAHDKYPNDVICRYAKNIGRLDSEMLSAYNQWKGASVPNKGDIFFGSGGGTLFQPSKMIDEVSNIVLAQKLTPLADDIWLNAMTRLSNQRIRLITNELYLFFDKDESNSLSHLNVGESQNDIQLKNIIEYYKETICKNPFKKVVYEN